MRCLTIPAILFVTGVLFAAPPKVVEVISGKVIAVTDGDTITVLVNKQATTVRLEGIDAPESGQSFGTKSKQALSEMVFGKPVTVKKIGDDGYGRTLGIVMAGNVDANARMIENGWAWHFRKYNDEERLAKLEAAARSNRRGLWADANPHAPWDYRARQETPEPKPKASSVEKTAYWLNTSSGVRHNQGCEHFKKTKKGRFCAPTEGKACGICGG